MSAAVAVAPAEATNGPKLTAYGARAAGRGGVDYAFADDATGPATNPAGMGFIYGNRLDNNWAVIFIDAKWRNSFGEFENENKPFVPAPAFSFGVVFSTPPSGWEIAPLFDMGRWGLVEDEAKEGAKPRPKADAAPGDADTPKDPPAEAGPDNDPFTPDEELTDEDLYGGRLKLGFGVFPVTGGKVQFKDFRNPRGPGQPAFAEPQDWELDALSVAVVPSLAYRFNKYFSMGLSLQLIYTAFELDGGIAQPSSTLRDDFELANSILSVNPQIITMADTDDGKGANASIGIAGRLGLMFNSRHFSFGVIYQERSHSSDVLGRATVDATDETNVLTNGNTALLQIVDPQIDPSRGFISEYDLRVQDLETMPRMVGVGIAVRPHRRVALGLDYTFIWWSEVYRTFKVRLSHGSNPNLDIMTSPSIAVRVPLRLEDQHVIAVGASFLAYEGQDLVEGVPSWTLVLRMGYNFGKTPVPGNTTLPQQPTIGEHHLSTGFSIYWGPLIELSFAAEWTLPNELDTGTHIGDFTLSNSEQEEQKLFLHFGLGVNF